MPRRVKPLIAVLVLALSTPSRASASGADSAFSSYIDAVLADDWSATESLWLPEEVALAKRFGVEFTGVPLKVDCSSPLLEHRLALRNKTIQMAVTDSAVADTLVAKIVTLRSGGQPAALSHTYLLISTPAGWRITSPIYHATRAWPVIETRFTRVRCPDSTLLNQSALDAMDNFIDSLGTIFHFHADEWARLNREKLDYYLADRATITALTGYDARGMTYLPLDAIVTSNLPHEHEIVHALINFRLAPLPMYTLPALQEGVAVSYGGRWRKTPQVIMHLGAFVIKSGLMSVEDVLTHSGFNSDASDLSYALGGLFTRCLIESMGFPQFAALYRRLSGPQQYIRNLTLHEIHKAAEESTGQPWELLIPSCVEREVATFSHRGIDPLAYMPPSEFLWSKFTNGVEAILNETTDYYYLEVGGEYAGRAMGVCLKSDSLFTRSGYKSRLFAEQFPEQPYDGQICGIVFDSLEAGIYDYRTDMLLAKFASGFSQGESIWDAESRVVRFKVDKGVLPVDLRSGSLTLVW